MKILINSSDFHDISNVSGAFQFDKLVTHIRSIERNLIKPYLGSTLYAALVAAYDEGNGNPTEDQQNLIDLIQPIETHLAMWMASDQLNVDITDKGFQASHSGDKKPAFEWQFRNAKASFRKTGFSAVEDLLEFLEENQDTYPDWESSEASNKNRDLIINSAKEFSEYVTVDRSMFTLLRPFQLRQMRTAIKSLLGADLYADILEDIKLDAPSPDNLKLMDDIKIITAHLTYADALSDLPVTTDEEGVHFFNNAFSGNFSGKETADKTYLSSLIDKHNRIASRSFDELVCYLNENVATYPLFETSSNYTPPASEETEEEDDESDSGILDI